MDRLSAEARLALASYDAGDAHQSKPFKFEPRRARLDWRLLSAVDVDRIARETDIDTLEQALDTVAFGDVTVEDPRLLTGAIARRRAGAAGRALVEAEWVSCGDKVLPGAVSHVRCVKFFLLLHSSGPNFLKVFRLGQLTVEYLLHVQVHLRTLRFHLDLPSAARLNCHFEGASPISAPRAAQSCSQAAPRAKR